MAMVSYPDISAIAVWLSGFIHSSNRADYSVHVLEAHAARAPGFADSHFHRNKSSASLHTQAARAPGIFPGRANEKVDHNNSDSWSLSFRDNGRSGAVPVSQSERRKPAGPAPTNLRRIAATQVGSDPASD